MCGGSLRHYEEQDGKSIMYAVNDTIMYGAQGVCSVAGIRKETIAGMTNEYYVLKPVDTTQSTIYVPTNNENLTKKMRPVLTAEKIHEIIRSMPDTDALWIENETERKEKYQALIKEGDPASLIQIIKALYVQQQRQQAKGRKLHIADQHYFKMAEKLLYEEFAVALHLEQEEVLPFIVERLELADQEKAGV